MSRRFLGALARRDLSEIRRALFLDPLLTRNSGAQPAQDPEQTGGDGPPAADPVPSDTMMLPKPPPMPQAASNSPPG
jgi:hypothetical protein